MRKIKVKVHQSVSNMSANHSLVLFYSIEWFLKKQSVQWKREIESIRSNVETLKLFFLPKVFFDVESLELGLKMCLNMIDTQMYTIYTYRANEFFNQRGDLAYYLELYYALRRFKNDFVSHTRRLIESMQTLERKLLIHTLHERWRLWSQAGKTSVKHNMERFFRVIDNFCQSMDIIDPYIFNPNSGTWLPGRHPYLHEKIEASFNTVKFSYTFF